MLIKILKSILIIGIVVALTGCGESIHKRAVKCDDAEAKKLVIDIFKNVQGNGWFGYDRYINISLENIRTHYLDDEYQESECSGVIKYDSYKVNDNGEMHSAENGHETNNFRYNISITSEKKMYVEALDLFNKPWNISQQ